MQTDFYGQYSQKSFVFPEAPAPVPTYPLFPIEKPNALAGCATFTP